MKNRKFLSFALIFALLAVAAAPCSLAAGSGTGESEYINRTELLDGFSYTNAISHNSGGGRVETFMLDVGASGDVYPIVMACDTIYGGMTVEEMIAYAEEQGYRVLGAVNSDFFAQSTKIPLGIVIENGIYKSSPEEENIFLISEDGADVLEKTEVTLRFSNSGGGEYVDEATGETVTSTGFELAVTHLNKMRHDYGGIYAFTEAFSTESTRSSTPGISVRMKMHGGEMRLGAELELEVEEVIAGDEPVPIGEGYIVLSAADNNSWSDPLKGFAVGDKVTLKIDCGSEELTKALCATGCGDILAADGVMTDTSGWDTELFGYNPRTAVGIREDGSMVFYVVDGRASNYSNGAKMSEIAADLTDIGCRYVINLDGGASTVMALKKPGTAHAEVITRPSNGKSRSCAAYILFVTDNESSDRTERMFIAEDGEFLLVGSSLPLNAISADSALYDAEILKRVTYSASLGSFEGGGTAYIYTANEAGEDRITVSANGVEGSGTIHNLDTVDDLTVTDAATGRAPVLSGLKAGDTVQLDVKLTRLSRQVHFSYSCVDFSLSENVGTVSEDGLVTITGEPGAEGELSVTAGGVTKTFPVTLSVIFDDIQGHWAKSYIEMLYEAGIVNGTGDGKTFSPNDYITRGDFVLMLWRAMGRPAPEGPAGFTDVTDDMYYSEAIAWAREAGVTNGTGGGLFEPRGTLTRDQAFTFVFRALFNEDKPEEEYDLSMLDMFSDSAEIRDFARVASAELVLRGIIEGSGGKLSPLKEITRGEMAKILCMSLYMDY